MVSIKPEIIDLTYDDNIKTEVIDPSYNDTPHTTTSTTPHTTTSTTTANVPATSQRTYSVTPTVYKSYSLATVPKFSATGKVLTFGQRLALIRKQKELDEEAQQNSVTVESNNSNDNRRGTVSEPVITIPDTTTTLPSSAPQTCTHGRRIATDSIVSVKVLIPLSLRDAIASRDTSYYENQTGCTVAKCPNPYPTLQEFQLFVRGQGSQVSHALCLLTDELRQKYTLSPGEQWRGRNRTIPRNREESMLIVVPRNFRSDLLRFASRDSTMLREIEVNNQIWIKIQQFLVISECLVQLTGHREQLKCGIREFIDRLSQTCYSDTLPSLLYYKQIPSHHEHLECVWQSCDKRTYEQWCHELSYFSSYERSRSRSPIQCYRDYGVPQDNGYGDYTGYCG